MSFTGEFRHTVDAKGRLIVPSRLRDELSGDKVVLTPWTNGCIGLWSGEGWEVLKRKLIEQRKGERTASAFVRAIGAGAHTDEVDRQGRITIPASLRNHAGITRDVVITGAIDHGEIWSPEGWEREQEKWDEGRFDELVQGLDI